MQRQGSRPKNVFLVLAAAAAQLYRTVLDRCTHIALDRREFLTAEFCRSS